MTELVSSASIDAPWLDYASTRVPDDFVQIMRWAQYLWMCDGNYRSAMERVARHFITSLSFPELEAAEETEFRDFFSKQLKFDEVCERIGNELLAYGQVVAGLYLPFKRYLSCAKCSRTQPIERVEYRLVMGDTLTWKRTSPCPSCGDNSPYHVDDRKDPDMSRVKVNTYSPFELDIAYNRHSEKRDVYWRIPAMDRRNYLSGARIFIDSTPIEFLEASAQNARVKLNEEFLFVATRDGLSGFRTNGRGVPEAIKVFRAAWLNQLTNRADQAIVMDYTLGKRVVSPGLPPGQMDPMVHGDMTKFVGAVNHMFNEHRENPATIHTSPYPLNYQFMGGEGAALIPPDKLKFRNQEFLSQLNIPLEYHQMTLSTQAAPMALRLFEACWKYIPNVYNRALDWIVNCTSSQFDLTPTKVELRRSTIADDVERKQILGQLMAGNQISPQTALEPYDIEAAEEVKRVYQHQAYVAKVEKEFAEDDSKAQEMAAMQSLTANPTPASIAAAQQQQAAGPGATMGGIPAGGMPGGAGGGQQSPTLTGMSEQSQAIAQQLVSMPEYDRKQQLRGLRESNRDLHALVKSEMERLRSDARSQGQQMLLAPPPAGG